MSRANLAGSLGMVAGVILLALAAPAGAEPEPLEATISGSPVVGKRLTAKPNGEYTYAWQRCKTNEPAGCPTDFIGGATRRTYKLVKKDLRSWIRVLVTPIPVPPVPTPSYPGGTDPRPTRRLIPPAAGRSW